MKKTLKNMLIATCAAAGIGIGAVAIHHSEMRLPSETQPALERQVEEEIPAHAQSFRIKNNNEPHTTPRYLLRPEKERIVVLDHWGGDPRDDPHRLHWYEHRLHFYESPSDKTPLIKPGDYFVLTSIDAAKDIVRWHSRLLSYSGKDAHDLYFATSPATTGLPDHQFFVPYDITTNTAYVVIEDKKFRIQVDPATKNIAVDQNADGVIDGKHVSIIDIDGNITTETDLKQK